MASCMAELFVWSLKNETCIPDTVTGFHIYHEKNSVSTASDHGYAAERKAYDESRNLMWIPKNRRPERLRDLLKDTEEFLAQNECVQISWLARRLMQVVLSNGCILTFYLSGSSGDVERIFIDKSLVGRLGSDNVSDVFLNDVFMMVAYVDNTRLDYIYFTKRSSVADKGKKVEKLSNMDPKTLQVELPGNGMRRLKRKLSVNSLHTMVLVWWVSSVNEVWPWSPATSDRDKSNVIVLSLNGPQAEIFTYMKTEFNPIHIAFSVNSPNDVYSIERMPQSTSDTRVNVSVYQISSNKITRMSSTTIPLKSNMLSHNRNLTEERLLLGCEDGTIVLCHSNASSTLYTKSQVVPHVISWHPAGCLFLVANSRGDIQAFDVALNPLTLWLVAEQPAYDPVLRLSTIFTNPVTLKRLEWFAAKNDTTTDATDGVVANGDILAVTFDKGPIGVMLVCAGPYSSKRLSTVDLTREYLKHRQINEAVNILRSMSWDMQGPDCYSCLSILMNHLLKLPLNAEREGQMEAILGSFYAPKVTISDKTIMEYRDPISRLARRFFHHLLRYARFDKAFLLAIDIGARDLFMDIHYMALDRGESVLADVAYQKAEDIECLSPGSSSLEDFESEEESLDDERDGSYTQQMQDPVSSKSALPNFSLRNHMHLKSPPLHYSHERTYDEIQSERDGGYMEDLVVESLTDLTQKTQKISLNPPKTNICQNVPSDIVGSEIPIDDWSPSGINSPKMNSIHHSHREETLRSTSRKSAYNVTQISDHVNERLWNGVRDPKRSHVTPLRDDDLSRKVASNNRFIEKNMSAIKDNQESFSYNKAVNNRRTNDKVTGSRRNVSPCQQHSASCTRHLSSEVTQQRASPTDTQNHIDHRHNACPHQHQHAGAINHQHHQHADPTYHQCTYINNQHANPALYKSNDPYQQQYNDMTNSSLSPDMNGHGCCLHNCDQHHTYDQSNCTNHNPHLTLSPDNSSQRLSSVSPSSYKDSEYSISSHKDSSVSPNFRTPTRYSVAPSDVSQYSAQFSRSDASQCSRRFTPSDVSQRSYHCPSSDASVHSKRRSSNASRHSYPACDQNHRCPSSESFHHLKSRETSQYKHHSSTDTLYQQSQRSTPADTSQHRATLHQKTGHVASNKQQFRSRMLPTSPPFNVSTSRKSASYQNLHDANDIFDQHPHQRKDRVSSIHGDQSPTITSKSIVSKDDEESQNIHQKTQSVSHRKYVESNNRHKQTGVSRAGDASMTSTHRMSMPHKDHMPVAQSNSLEGRINGHRPLSRQYYADKMWNHDVKTIASQKKHKMSASTDFVNRVGSDDFRSQKFQDHRPKPDSIQKVQADMERGSNANVIHFGIV